MILQDKLVLGKIRDNYEEKKKNIYINFTDVLSLNLKVE